MVVERGAAIGLHSASTSYLHKPKSPISVRKKEDRPARQHGVTQGLRDRIEPVTPGMAAKIVSLKDIQYAS